MTSCIHLCFGDYWFDLKFLMPQPLIAKTAKQILAPMQISCELLDGFRVSQFNDACFQN